MERDGESSSIFAIKHAFCRLQTAAGFVVDHSALQTKAVGSNYSIDVVLKDSGEGTTNVLHLLSYQSMQCIHIINQVELEVSCICSWFMQASLRFSTFRCCNAHFSTEPPTSFAVQHGLDEIAWICRSGTWPGRVIDDSHPHPRPHPILILIIILILVPPLEMT